MPTPDLLDFKIEVGWTLVPQFEDIAVKKKIIFWSIDNYSDTFVAEFPKVESLTLGYRVWLLVWTY